MISEADSVPTGKRRERRFPVGSVDIADPGLADMDRYLIDLSLHGPRLGMRSLLYVRNWRSHPLPFYTV